MATITKPKLTIDPEKNNERKVHVDYSLTFSAQEVLAGAVFYDVIRLYGDDRNEGGDVRFLAYVKRRIVKAGELEDGTQGPHVRNIYKRFSVQKLDEDADDFATDITHYPDELFAEVSVEPFVGTGHKRKSDTWEEQVRT